MAAQEEAPNPTAQLADPHAGGDLRRLLRRGGFLLDLLHVGAALASFAVSAFSNSGPALILLFVCWALWLTLWLASLEPRLLASAASAASRIAEALAGFFLGEGEGGEGGSAAGRDLVRVAAIPLPAYFLIVATPFLLCVVGELGTENAFAVFACWIISAGVIFGFPTAARIATLVAAALRNYVAY